MSKIALSEVKVGENYSRDGEGDVTTLVRSLETYGLQQPIILDKQNNLVAGFRRFSAAKQLGWTEIEYTVTDQEPGIVNLIENLERESLSFYEECLAIKRVYPGCSSAEIAAALGRTTGWSRPRKEMWTLPQQAIDMVRTGEITATQVIMLVNAKDPQPLIDKLVNKESPDLPQRVRRGKKELQAIMTCALERGLMDVAQTLRFVIGDITEEELFDEVDK